MERPLVIAQSDTAGGAEAYLVRLYSELARGGSEARLLGRVPGWSATGLTASDIGLGAKWGSSNILFGLARLPIEAKRLREHLGSPSYVHMQFKREQIGFTALASKSAPVVWTEHGQLLRGTKGRLLNSGYAAAAKHVSLIVCVSANVATSVRQVVGAGVRVEVVGNAVDSVRLRPPEPGQRADARAGLLLGPEIPVLLWVGRTAEAKLPLLAAEASRKWPGIMLMVGGGDQAPQLIELAGRFPQRLRYLGRRSDVERFYRAADVFMFTSSGAGEGMPTVLLEAAAHGLPVVANDSCGVADLVTELGGTVHRTTGHDLAEGAIAALRNSQEMGQAARIWAEKHDLVPWAARHRTLFDELLN